MMRESPRAQQEVAMSTRQRSRQSGCSGKGDRIVETDLERENPASLQLSREAALRPGTS